MTVLEPKACRCGLPMRRHRGCFWCSVCDEPWVQEASHDEAVIPLRPKENG